MMEDEDEAEDEEDNATGNECVDSLSSVSTLLLSLLWMCFCLKGMV